MKKLSVLTAGILMMFSLATVTFYTSCTDPCKDVECNDPNGTCVEGTCNCEVGYEGDDCGTEERAKFLGTFSVSGTITCPVSGNGTITGTVFTVSNSSSSIQKIVLNFGGALTLTATVNGTSFTIDNSSISGYDYSGQGSISGNNITCTINEYDGALLETCIYSFTGPKQ